MKEKNMLKMIQKLRKITNISITECKKAIEKTNGNLNLAIKNIYEKCVKNNNKNILLKEGIILAKLSSNKQKGILIELNSETDFVSNSEMFQNLGKKIINFAIDNDIKNINVLKNNFLNEIKILTSKLGENIQIGKIKNIMGEKLEFYLHRNKIGVIVSSNQNTENKIMKSIAMQIAANNPKYLNINLIPKEKIIAKKEEYLKSIKILNKETNLINKIIDGKINKFIENYVLYNQKLIFDNTKTVEQFLKENKSQINDFIYLKLGN